MKTSENHGADQSDDNDQDDYESLENANDLYNSMLKKLNASEDLLAESPRAAVAESFNSETESFDLSEHHLNDQSLKLSSHSLC